MGEFFHPFFCLLIFLGSYINPMEIKIKSCLDGRFGMIPFELHDKQKEILNNLQVNKYNIIRQSRAVGITTLLAKQVADKIMTEQTTTVYIGPNMGCGHYFKTLVHDLLIQESVEFKSNSITELSVYGGGTLLIKLTNNILMGSSYDYVILEGFTNFLRKFDIEAMYHITKKITIASTPTKPTTGYNAKNYNPNPNDFNHIYFDSMLGYNNFYISDYLWYDHPIFGKDDYWQQTLDSNLKFYDKGSLEMKTRMTNLGFVHLSPTYLKYLNTFGYHSEQCKYELDAHM